MSSEDPESRPRNTELDADSIETASNPESQPGTSEPEAESIASTSNPETLPSPTEIAAETVTTASATEVYETVPEEELDEYTPAPELAEPIAPPPSAKERLVSLDALRGFDMFWIVGAEELVKGLNTASQTAADGPIATKVKSAAAYCALQLEHVQWAGFHFYDMIFPLFVFLAGVSIPYYLDRIVCTDGKLWAHFRVLRRFVLLYVVGLIYYHGISRTTIAAPFQGVRFVGVLQRIAVSSFFAGLLYLNLRLRGLIIACMVLLVGYWAFFWIFPVPAEPALAARATELAKELNLGPDQSWGMGGRSFAEGNNWHNYIDYHYLPGRRWDHGDWDPEGLLSTIPAIGSALLGVFAGMLLRNKNIAPAVKVQCLMFGGVAGVISGSIWGWGSMFGGHSTLYTVLGIVGGFAVLGLLAWQLFTRVSEMKTLQYVVVAMLAFVLLCSVCGLQFPVIKNIWSSSFVLVAGGYSAILLGFFYLVIDVLNFKKWAVPFVWIGSNSLAIYLAAQWIDFQEIANGLTGGIVKEHAGAYGDLLVAATFLFLILVFVRFLYKREIFFRL
jgi:predicted acyltransferase